MARHGLEATTPAIELAVARNAARLKREYGTKLGFPDADLRAALEALALDADSEGEAVGLLDRATPATLDQVVMYL